MKKFKSGDIIVFMYQHHLTGEIQEREVIVKSVEWNDINDHYPDDRWFVNGYCLDRRDHRTFSLSKMKLR